MAKRKRLTISDPVFDTRKPHADDVSPHEAVAPSDARKNTGTREHRSLRPPIAGVAGDAATAAALDEISAEFQAARHEGRMVMDLPLGCVQLDYLVRDRVAVQDEEMDALKASLRARGQQVPIEVVEIGPKRYGLISGWRRCQALMALHAETGEERFGRVGAVLRRPSDAPETYLAMVEENEIRVGLSYYERARIVVKSTEQGVFETNREALRELFHAASRAKRSKIGTFVQIVEELDGALRFPEALTERQGLALARALQEKAGLAARLRATLSEAVPGSAEEEAAWLTQVIQGGSKTTSRKAVAERGEETSSEPCAGIRVRTHADGSITLSGAGVTDEMRARLIRWLAGEEG